MRPKTRRRLPLSLSAALLALGLTACDPASQAMLAGASLVSFVHTDKTVGDHFATWAFDKDCSTLTLANGEGYCRAFVSAEEQAATYCYRTLGDITRSEEHTSELQSLMRISYAVFCLKKKKYTS